MGIYGGSRFKEATQAKTPQFSLAAARQGQGDNAERSQQIALAKSLKTGYNDLMGENTPIGDQFNSWFGSTPDGGTAADYSGEAMSNWNAAQGAETANALRSAETGMQTAEQIAAATEAAAAAETAAAAEAAATAAAAETGATAAASSTPWGLILAAAMANEGGALASGRRDEDEASYRTDLATGAVLEQDAEALGDKVGGPLGKTIEVGGAIGNPEGAYKTLLKNPTEKIIDDPFNPFAMFS